MILIVLSLVTIGQKWTKTEKRENETQPKATIYLQRSQPSTSQNFLDFSQLAIDRQICFLCFPFTLFSYTFLVFMTLHWPIGYIFYGQPCSQAGRGLEVEAQLRNSLKEASVGLQTFKPSVNNCLSIKLYSRLIF